MGKRKQPTRYSKRIAFISCSKTKKSIPCKAKEMYQGALFKKSFKYCSLHFDEVWILSAKYGLLHPEKEIKPYNITLKDFSANKKKEWSSNVRRQIEKHEMASPITVFAGTAYTKYLIDLFEIPLKGVSLGNQLKWFNENLKPGFNIC